MKRQPQLNTKTPDPSDPRHYYLFPLLLTLTSLVVASPAQGAGKGCAIGVRVAHEQGGDRGLERGRFHLTPSQSICLPGRATLTFVRVLEDTRCPPGSSCVRKGRAAVYLRGRTATLRPRGRVTLGRTIRMAGSKIRLAALTPIGQAASSSVTPIATFEVTVRCTSGCLPLEDPPRNPPVSCGANIRCSSIEEPVCAKSPSGTPKSYRNRCIALTDCATEVIAEGPCPGSPCVPNPQRACPEIYGPVCGVVIGSTTPTRGNVPSTLGQAVTYENDCRASAECATVIAQGECPKPEPCNPNNMSCPTDGAQLCGIIPNGSVRNLRNECEARQQCAIVVAHGACGTPPPPPTEEVWGGRGISLTLIPGATPGSYTSGRFAFDCADASIDEPFTIGPNSTFEAKGGFSPGIGGPVRVDQVVSRISSIFSGRLEGDTLTLTIKSVSEGEDFGTFTLTRGVTGTLMRCL